MFLEVHIQNLTQKPMTFQRVLFECVDGWTVEDVNEGLYVGTAATVPAQEVRQYLYVLTPHLAKSRKIVNPPVAGSIIPLGRLDISWTTTFGEPGRLLTSVSHLFQWEEQKSRSRIVVTASVTTSAIGRGSTAFCAPRSRAAAESPHCSLSISCGHHWQSPLISRTVQSARDAAISSTVPHDSCRANTPGSSHSTGNYGVIAHSTVAWSA